MPESTATVYLITGANRGIGLSIATVLARRENALVFATARQPAKAEALNALAKETGRVEVVKYESANEEDTKSLAQVIEDKAGKVDVVIANAGVQTDFDSILKTTHQNLTQSFDVNAVGPILLFQALYHLLRKSSAPQFAVVSSALGSIALGFPFESDAYGISKAAVNYAVKRISLYLGQNDRINAYVLHPGVVTSDMGLHATTSVADSGAGFEFPPDLLISPEQSAKFIADLVDNASLEKTGGKFWDATTGNEIPW
ncbi:hypothetical protein Rhopal_003841-T1 [Rhodotorula paludigena]|uniref:Ketoreductase domain-containing protein n=1 Tax=Rhodotorula paludigena TaxID=86838 RepID=A0AAV5GMW0_9BASI|nr:hypothetical protein Rhopal_003841-T1 [Rhodotorula paludigena]